ncbi:RNA-binding (RRM/RBD/RNP motifs) family protein [Raphanus sativus]|nr:RNA-binding (RRM/RBD/RNP motifs) family protein [Raphanus sativus]
MANSSILLSDLKFDQSSSSELSDFVAGLSFSSTEETLTLAFSQYGRVLAGFAYVTFSSKEEAVKALLELNGKLVDGRVVIRDTTKVVKQNRPFHIKDLNKILARSVAVFLGFGSIGMG